jgi:hypothetical protein
MLLDGALQEFAGAAFDQVIGARAWADTPLSAAGVPTSR